MIQVSNEFKKAIKESERRIKGYVEVLYDLPNITVTPSVNATSTYTPTSEISNGVRVENLYGSLDYLPLDGSYITMGDTNTNIGYISDELFENLTNPTVTLSFSSTTINGITMYFRENPPTNMTLNYSDGTSQTITNDENTVQVIFDSPKTLTNVSITINDMMYQDRKIYIMEIDLGVTQVYKDQDLIEFTVDEEVNKLVEEVPINETNIILNNMSDLFNPLNPKGIVPYLSENTLIKPYIGVLTETQGVEYVKMGEFYFDSYTNNSDATTTLVGKNIIKRIEKEELNDNNEFNFFQTVITESEFNLYIENFNYEIENLNWTHNIPAFALNTSNLLEFLKQMAFGQWNLISANRNSKIKIYQIDNEIKTQLSKFELINDVNYKEIDKINTIKLITKKSGGSIDVSDREIFRTTVTLKENTQIFLVKMDAPQLLLARLSQSGGTSANIVSQGQYMAFVKVVGTVGSDVELIFSSNKDFVPYVANSIKTNGKKPEVALEFDSFMNYLPKQYIDNSNILDITPSYEMSFDYNGDPSLEAGDYINVETPYGYKPLFIQKNRFKFDGGLSGSIEGVE